MGGPEGAPVGEPPFGSSVMARVRSPEGATGSGCEKLASSTTPSDFGASLGAIDHNS